MLAIAIATMRPLIEEPLLRLPDDLERAGAGVEPVKKPCLRRFGCGGFEVRRLDGAGIGHVG